jgi:hypothetical protein
MNVTFRRLTTPLLAGAPAITSAAGGARSFTNTYDTAVIDGAYGECGLANNFSPQCARQAILRWSGC